MREMGGRGLQVESCAKVPTMARQTYRGNLEEQKENLEKRLADINAVLEALDKSPDVANVVEAINRLSR